MFFLRPLQTKNIMKKELHRQARKKQAHVVSLSRPPNWGPFPSRPTLLDPSDPSLRVRMSLRGRAYPDLSAVGANVPIFFEGRLTMARGLRRTRGGGSGCENRAPLKPTLKQVPSKIYMSIYIHVYVDKQIDIVVLDTGASALSGGPPENGFGFPGGFPFPTKNGVPTFSLAACQVQGRGG